MKDLGATKDREIGGASNFEHVGSFFHAGRPYQLTSGSLGLSLVVVSFLGEGGPLSFIFWLEEFLDLLFSQRQNWQDARVLEGL